MILSTIKPVNRSQYRKFTLEDIKEIIIADRGKVSVKDTCKKLDISRSSYYRFLTLLGITIQKELRGGNDSNYNDDEEFYRDLDRRKPVETIQISRTTTS